MQSPFTSLRISVTDEEVGITLQGESESIEFGGIAPTTIDSSDMPAHLYRLNPSDRPDEYVITLEFDREAEETEIGASLVRLDAHIRDVKIRIHDDGYFLDGEITGWIGYTNAVPSTSG